MRKLVLYFALALFVPILWLASERTSRPTLSVATGNPSGVYYPLGGGLASIWSRSLPGVNIKAEVTAGSVTNLIQVARGESEIGFTQATL